MDKISIELMTADTARKKLEKAREERIKSENKRETKKVESEEFLYEKAYQEMLLKVSASISCAILDLHDSCSVQIGVRQFESQYNKRNRKALQNIKDILREIGYQTHWKFDQIEDDGFNREFFDELNISWNPLIRWNDFGE